MCCTSQGKFQNIACVFYIIPYSFCGYSWLALAYQLLKLFFYLNICICETSFQRSLDFCATMYNQLIDLPFIQHGMENFWAFASLSNFQTSTLFHIHSIVEFSNFVQCSQFKNNLINQMVDIFLINHICFGWVLGRSV